MKCSKCGKEITGNFHLSEDREPLCYDCTSNMNRCNCGVYIDKGIICKKCAEHAFDKVINNYSTKLKHLFKNKEDVNKCLNKIYYGLEMEYNNISPELFYYKNKDLYKDKLIYNKVDRSVNRGFEVNIIPSDYSSIKQIINRLDLSFLLKRRMAEELYSNAGVHIHISSNGIPREDKYKLNLLFNNNINKQYCKYIYLLTNRTKSVASIYDDIYFSIGKIKYKCRLEMSHNCAVNFGNTNTVEFRLFGATVSKKRLLGYIEFVNLSLDFVNKNPIRKMSLKNLLIYMKIHAKNLCNKVAIKKIEKSGLMLDDEVEINFSYKKLFELFNLIKDKDYKEKIKMLSMIPLYKIDNKIDEKNYKCYVMDETNNNFEDKLRDKLIKMIIRKEEYICV